MSPEELVSMATLVTLYRLITREDIKLIYAIKDPNNDPNIGSARGNNKSSTSEALQTVGITASTSGMALLSTFLPAFILAALCFLIFLICRRTQRRFYSPRSYLGHMHDHERSPELPHGFVNWIGEFIRLPDSHVLRHSSLDGYFFLRFLKKMSLLSFIGCCITWPILMPIHITGGAGNTQLDVLTFSNVVNPKRYYAHTIVSWIFFGFVFLMVCRESIFYAALRQAYLLSPLYADRISSRTVLFMSVPQSYQNKAKLSKIFGDSVKRVWTSEDTSKLARLVRKRDNLAYSLEGAETRYVKNAHAARLKALKKQGRDLEVSLEEAAVKQSSNESDLHQSPWLLHVKRPSRRSHYLFGEKVDIIENLRSRLAALIPKVEALQQEHRVGEAKSVGGVFVEFTTQREAQIAYQTLSHHHPSQMTPRFIGIPPHQVLWPALRYSWYQRIVRKFAVQGFIAVLIIFWSIPSALIGSISNITYLTNLLKFLSFVNELPSFIKGVISGLLPAAGLAILMSAVPWIMRWCARQSGVPSTAKAELFTQNAHFCFQVVQVFLVTTITSAASAATSQIIKNPLSAKDLLAKNLPKATNFYISYFLFQGLMLSSGAVVQVIAFLVFQVLRTVFDTTPRKLYSRWAALTGVWWGTVFPVFTNMTVIAITYSCIAPLVLGFSALGLYLVYQAYRYNLLFVYEPVIDTKGLVYPRALQQVLTGVYLAEICMFGLFAIRAAIGPMVLMGMFTVFTGLCHISLNEALEPLLSALPHTLNNEEDWTCTTPSDLEKPRLLSRSMTSGKEFLPRRQNTLTLAEIATAPDSLSGKLKNFRWWLFHPSIYANYAALREKIRQDPSIPYDEQVSDNAYHPSCVYSQPPLLWIPRDAGGVSRQEVELTSAIIPMTDNEAHLNGKNKVVWDKVGMKPPIWEEKVFY
ncbi:phosphate metabolism protein 7 [Nannizzia gypsea CBS 118893]|uniref:Phosphate metabolism protein 7 n=1 Tax=Arthroderma gypseum (strain ATCC MYA-4604 / CBS 118893) TaxID=535722 RepID=E4UZM0_ARTGP|nr:phosphate metabolism protein 7 [Nannizzia gypsea CBS 118893]EFR03550.1 phosphate metabolism protein 7 [Nannizzia gypsea CBS 118893]